MPTLISFCGGLNGSSVAFKMESLPLEILGFYKCTSLSVKRHKLSLKTLNNVLLLEGLLLNPIIQIIPFLWFCQ